MLDPSPTRAEEGPVVTIAARFLGSVAVVGGRRLVRGRRRPSWTLVQEAALRAMERHTRDVTRMPSVADARAAMDNLAMARPYRQRDVSSQPVAVDGLEGEWFEPRAGATEAVVLYLHGGAYVFGSIDTVRDLLHRLTLAARCRTLAINYRLAPEHPFPAAIDDAVRTYQWILAQGIDPARIVLAGDSAGGGLTIATQLRLRELGVPLPAGTAVTSPWVDLTVTGETITTHAHYSWGNREFMLRWARAYLAGADPRTPLASPLYADLRGLPPLLVQLGGCEALVSEIEALAARAQGAGVEVTLTRYEDMVHAFQLMASLFPAGRAAVGELGRFIATTAAAPS